MSVSARNDSASNRERSSSKTRQLVVVALMCALAILLSFIEFPIFPSAAFLKLDISLVPSAFVGLAYGMGPGLLCGIACAVAHAIISGDWVGALMNSIVALAYIVPSALLYKRIHTNKGLVLALLLGTICLIAAITIANLIIDPTLYGIPFDAVASLVVPVIIPFNIIKGVVVSVITGLVLKSVSGMLASRAA